MAMLSTLFFAFYGLFSKLSTLQPTVVNLIIFTASGLCGIIPALIIERKITFSKEGFLSGICSGGSVLITLFMLVSNQVLVVFSFVSFSSVVFFLIILALEKPILSRKQEFLAVIGIVVSTVGLLIASTSMVGITNLSTNSLFNPYYLIIASGIPISTGFWAYFSFVAIKKVRSTVSTVLLSYSFAALAIALLGYSLFGLSSPLPAFSQLSNFFPVMAGLSLMGGVMLTLKAYEMTSGESRIEDTIVAILANAEIVPLIFLSYFILREFTIESIVGAFTVFIGLSILNAARAG
jgi:drug/metabolite transporter (DMT)-like permease